MTNIRREKISVSVEMEIFYDRPRMLVLYLGSREEMYYSYDTISGFCEAVPVVKKMVEDYHITFIVIRSINATVWNMGGDLELFVECQRTHNIALLRDYAYKCVEFVSQLNKGFGTDVQVISLVEGNAYGGGFECALATEFIISENQVLFSFPEVLFSTFPGMGAYSFLTRRIGHSNAQDIIHSGKRWSATEMKNYGIVDGICEKGKGLEYIENLIERNAFLSPEFSRICRKVNIGELKEIVDIWMRKVMEIKEEDIKLMERIVAAQKQKMGNRV
ncbi:MAG: crotonase/enoyl-CoA hydratase family protein [Bacteroidota bacterium]|nr:crotonase/enoyl-CoA hydratase family protein [Bacteroidota bacterium]